MSKQAAVVPLWRPALLQLLLPGLGHLYLRERLFGLFVFLVMLLAVLLFVASFFITLPILASIVMFGMPILFYIFSFADMNRIRKTLAEQGKRPGPNFRIFLAAALLYQLIAPVALGNFLIVNHPTIYRLESNGFAPQMRKGTWLIADRMSFQLRFLAFQRVILHDLPYRFDVVRVEDEEGNDRTGLIVGLPGESVEIIDGVVFVNNTPEMIAQNADRLTAGNWPLTQIDPYAILVAIPQTGGIDTVIEVPLDRSIASVRRLL